MREGVSEVTTKRLSLYLRVLADLEAEQIGKASSRVIAERCQLNPAQVRKDLSRFGGFGVRGVGYEVPRLRRTISGILGLDRPSRLVIVGAGNLGSALADYPGFNSEGFEIIALFDVQADRVGTVTRGGAPVHHIDDLQPVIRAQQVVLGIVAVPAASAQSAVDQLTAAGVKAILNFAPTRPRVEAEVSIRHVDLKVELESLSYLLANEAGRPSPR